MRELIRKAPSSDCVDFAFLVLGEEKVKEWLKLGLTIDEAVYYIHIVHALRFIMESGISESFREMVRDAMKPVLKVALCWMDRRNYLFYRVGVCEKRKVKFSNPTGKYCPKYWYPHASWYEEEIAVSLLKYEKANGYIQ